MPWASALAGTSPALLVQTKLDQVEAHSGLMRRSPRGDDRVVDVNSSEVLVHTLLWVDTLLAVRDLLQPFLGPRNAFFDCQALASHNKVSEASPNGAEASQAQGAESIRDRRSVRAPAP